MLRSYKQRIYPNKQQREHFVQAFGCVRYIYNKGLETKNKHYAETGETLNYFDLMAGMVKEEKATNEWLKEAYSQSLQESIRNLDNAFTRFFKGISDFPVFKKKSGRQSAQYSQGVKVDFERGKVFIPKAGEMSCVFDRQFVGKIKTCTVSKTPTDKYFISILVDDSKELLTKPPIEADTVVGIDLGIKDFVILSDGTKIPNPKFLKQQLERLKVLQRRASRKKAGSNNRRKANKKVAVLYERISNQRKDFLQKLSSKIIGDNQTVILEDLNVAGMLRNHKLAQAISDVSWSEFVRQLEYKAEWYGKNIIRIGRFEPSTKLCSCCGYKNNDLTLKDRYWDCPECGAHHDRDLNAAANIKKFGLIQVAKLGDPNKNEIQAAIKKDSSNKRRSRKAETSGQELPAELAEMPAPTSPVVRRGKQDRRSKKPLASAE